MTKCGNGYHATMETVFLGPDKNPCVSNKNRWCRYTNLTNVVVNVDMIIKEINSRIKFDVLLALKIRIGFVVLRDVFLPYHSRKFLHINK